MGLWLPAVGCTVHVSCAAFTVQNCTCAGAFLFKPGTLGPKQSRVWQMCGAACCYACNLHAVQMVFVISGKHMDLNED